MIALCACDHAIHEHTDRVGRCNGTVSSAQDPEYGPYACPCPVFDEEAHRG